MKWPKMYWYFQTWSLYPVLSFCLNAIDTGMAFYCLYV
jgi:hypothetical protein